MVVSHEIFIVILVVILTSIAVLFKKNTNKSDVFDHIYLINLDRRPDRLERFMKTYNASDMKDMSLSKISAIDGSEIDISKIPLSEVAKGELKQIETTGFRSKHYQLTRGAIGCYLSHVKVWRDVIENGDSHALIFEDDVNVPKDITQRIEQSIKNIPKDWDIVLFGFHCKDCENMTNYRKVNRFILLHCYIISNTAILKILKTQSLFPIQQQIDSYLSELAEDVLNIYTVKNPIVNQNGSRTDIQMPIIREKNVDVNDRMTINVEKK